MKIQIQARIDDFIKKKSISVIDIETTGFSHFNDCIVEIGIVELDLLTGKCTKLFDQVILEENKLDLKISGKQASKLLLIVKKFEDEFGEVGFVRQIREELEGLMIT